MSLSRFDFVNAVVADRDLLVTSSHAHACRVEPRTSDLAWHCDLDDGFVNTDEHDPPPSVRWVCRDLRLVPRVGTGVDIPLVEVRRPPEIDLAKLLRGLGRLTGLASRRPPGGDVEGRFIYTDPAGILDVDLRQRVESWPSAWHKFGDTRPAELWSIRRTAEGLVVTSTGWWDSAPALDHQIGLALDVARRLTAQQ